MSKTFRRKNINVKDHKSEYFREYYLKNKVRLNKTNTSNYRKRKLKIIENPDNVERFGQHANKCANFIRLLVFMRQTFPKELEKLLNPDPTPVSTLSKE